MKNVIENATHIEGLLYQHALSLKTSGENSKNPGTQFINGTIDIATNDVLTNVVTIHFTYVTPKTAKGSDNATFATLQNIINGTLCNIMEHGVDRAVKLRVDSAIGLNEFYSSRTGTEELVSVKRNEGGFVHVTQTLASDEKLRNTFKCDMVITKVVRLEADPDRDRPESANISGYIFDFRKALLPVTFTAVNPKAIDYFEGLNVSQKEPCFTKVWGNQISRTVVTRRVEESAFGEPSVTESTSTQRDFVITGTSVEPYVWDDETTITVNEFKEALQNREVALADIKKRQDDYNASRGVATAPAATSTATGFNF